MSLFDGPEVASVAVAVRIVSPVCHKTIQYCFFVVVVANRSRHFFCNWCYVLDIYYNNKLDRILCPGPIICSDSDNCDRDVLAKCRTPMTGTRNSARTHCGASFYSLLLRCCCCCCLHFLFCCTVVVVFLATQLYYMMCYMYYIMYLCERFVNLFRQHFPPSRCSIWWQFKRPTAGRQAG